MTQLALSLTSDAPAVTPLVVSYGAGVDSTAMLVAMRQRDIVPDLILFADPGAEWPETYSYLFAIQPWLERVSFPPLQVVRYIPTRAPYSSLEGNCLSNETLPSLAFGGHSCSLKWKAAAQEKYLKAWAPARRAWASGGVIVRAIGYDDSAADHRRVARQAGKVTMAIGLDDSPRDRTRSARRYATRVDNELFHYWYPLQDWGIDRARCVEIITAAGLPVPHKSSCVFCPAMKKPEILELAERHPHLAARAVALERGFLEGRHEKRSTRGLGRTFSWGAFLAERGVTL